MYEGKDDPLLIEHWDRTLERLDQDFQTRTDSSYNDFLLEKLEAVKSLVMIRCGIACNTCQGYGTRIYPDTSTWGNGCGGQAMTEGVCDTCWGTGRTDKSGVDLRKLKNDKDLTKVSIPDKENNKGAVSIQYTNWKGVQSIRRIMPIKMFYESNEFHTEKQWLLLAYDLDKGAERTFAVKDIHSWENENE